MTFAGVVGLRGGAAGAVNAGVIGAADVGAGVYGFGSPTAYAIYGQGDYGGTGMKSFVEPHPTDPTREIRYVCLEGPEAGTYFRGTGKIQGGSATIEVPESFRMVTADRGLTVVAMPMNEAATLVCTRKSLDTIVIRGSADVEFDYVVNGVRRSYADFQPVSENVDFVPRSAGDTSLVRGLPEESIRRLKANGILNDDGTINVDTARRLGWDRRPEWRSPSR
jgi:hypothetical protein